MNQNHAVIFSASRRLCGKCFWFFINLAQNKGTAAMKRALFTTLVVSLLIAHPALAGQITPPVPPAAATCQVCGMFVAKYPAWVSSLTFTDATTVYFDGPKDLFTYYLNPGKYGRARKLSDIAFLSVKDYYSLLSIDGQQAFYVYGSDVSGPMGKELVPFEKRADAEGFLKDHKGKNVLRFGEITRAFLKSLE
jgi:copper chaperone NosL